MAKPCKGMVIVSDGYFPAWEATMDGSRVPIYDADSAIRGGACWIGERIAWKCGSAQRPRTLVVL